ncbi:polysaccharide biosynthesis tyrosine autokinase [Candidatus Poribacteria bacterium]|nr:polysaccharide biosynthesis tyrosine autokinase [Candidatus Poribacteria bacterium]
MSIQKIPESNYQQDEQEVHNILKELWGIIKRRWWVILLVIAVVEVFTFYYAQVPEGPYKAEAVIRPVMITSSSFGAFGDLLGGSRMYVDMESEFEIIRGKRVAEKIIEKLELKELYHKETEKTEPTEGVFVEIDPDRKKRNLIRALQGRIDVDWKLSVNKRKLNLIEVSARSYSPKEAMDIANTAAEAYIEVYDSYKQEAWKELDDLMNEELAALEKDLEDTTDELYRIAEERGIVPAISGLLGAGMYEAEDEFPMGIASLKSRIMENELQLRLLQKDYGDWDPRVKNLKKEIQELERRLEIEQGKAKVKFDNLYDLRKLSAEVRFKQQLYGMLKASQQELKAQNIMQKRKPELVEAATLPLVPTEQSRRSGLSLAAVVGLFAGFGLAVLLEYLDASMRSSWDVKKSVSLPILGNIPRLKGTKNKPLSDMLITYKDPKSEHKKWLRKFYSESYRMLNVETLAAINGCKYPLSIPEKTIDRCVSVLIASPLPEEGKSIVAANIAISTAQTGKKTLLVDTDCHTPVQHEIMGVDMTAGLTDFIAGHANFEEIVNPTSIGNLYIIPAGRTIDGIDPSALLNSAGMDDFLELSREEFDVVIIDSPATIITSESLAISPKVDGVVLVVKTGETKKDIARHAKEMIDYSGGRLIGVVMNFSSAGKRDYKNYYPQ